MITTTYVVGSRRGCAVGCVSVAVVESWGRRRLLAMVVVSESEQTGVRNNITSTGDILGARKGLRCLFYNEYYATNDVKEATTTTTMATYPINHYLVPFTTCGNSHPVLFFPFRFFLY